MDRLMAKSMQQRLGKVDEDFKRLHFTIIDLLDQHEDLEMEQAIFDEHEDRIGELGDRLQQLVLVVKLCFNWLFCVSHEPCVAGYINSRVFSYTYID